MDNPMFGLSDSQNPDLSDALGGVQEGGLFELQTLGCFSAPRLLSAVSPAKSIPELLQKG